MPGQMLEEVQRQRGVVEPLVAPQGKAIAVVEVAHHRQGGLYLCGVQPVRRCGSFQGGAQFSLGKAAQVVIILITAQVFRHVVAAGDVAEHHRRDSGQKHPVNPLSLRAGFDRLEERLDRPLALHQFVITVCAAQRTDHHFIGEIVVFINQHIEFVGRRRDGGEQTAQRRQPISWMAFYRCLQHFPVLHGERFDSGIDMAVERGGDGISITLGIDHGKVELEDEIAVMQRRGVLTDLQPAKHLFKIIRPRQVVIVFQRGQPQALAEPARAQKQQLNARFFEQRNPVGAIHVEIAAFADFAEVSNAIGKAHDLHLVESDCSRYYAGAWEPDQKTKSLSTAHQPHMVAANLIIGVHMAVDEADVRDVVQKVTVDRGGPVP